MSRVQTIPVSEADSDQRLDRWLRRIFPHLTQGMVEKMCRKGELRVDGGRVKAATRLVAGQEVRIPPLPDPEQMTIVAQTRLHPADIKMMQQAAFHLHRVFGHDDGNRPFGQHLPPCIDKACQSLVSHVVPDPNADAISVAHEA